MTEGFRRRLFGGRSAAQESRGAGEIARDPVCGMAVDQNKAAATSEYKGKTYYFCAQGCKRVFDADPEKYLSHEPGAHGSQH